MSHLSTLISRVKHHGVKEYFKSDPIFEQAVINLMEYLEGYPEEITSEEKAEALELYDKHRDDIAGKLMPSHKKRLSQADEIRSGF